MKKGTKFINKGLLFYATTSFALPRFARILCITGKRNYRADGPQHYQNVRVKTKTIQCFWTARSCARAKIKAECILLGCQAGCKQAGSSTQWGLFMHSKTFFRDHFKETVLKDSANFQHLILRSIRGGKNLERLGSTWYIDKSNRAFLQPDLQGKAREILIYIYSCRSKWF